MWCRKGPPPKGANTWEVDAKGDLDENEGEETSELGGEGGGGGQLGGHEGGGQEEDGGEEETLIIMMMMTLVTTVMVMMRMVKRLDARKGIVESRRPRWGNQVVDIARKT